MLIAHLSLQFGTQNELNKKYDYNTNAQRIQKVVLRKKLQINNSMSFIFACKSSCQRQLVHRDSLGLLAD